MVRRDFNRTPLGCYRVSRDCQGVWPARHGTVVNTPATRYMGRVTTRSVLSPVQEGFASIVLGECHLHRGSGGILRATRALPCPPGHLALLPSPASETQAQGRVEDRRKAEGVAPGRCQGLGGGHEVKQGLVWRDGGEGAKGCPGMVQMSREQPAPATLCFAPGSRADPAPARSGADARGRSSPDPARWVPHAP